MLTDHVNVAVRERVSLVNPDEPLEMVGFTVARYKFACKWLRPADHVLEVGCGEGFGAHFLAKHCAQVTAMDLDPAVVSACQERYQRDNLEFVVDDMTKARPTRRPLYDTIVCLEMIEHVDQDAGVALVNNVAECLRAGGLFVLSTPRSRLDRSRSRQEMHVFEYDYATLMAMLEPHFGRVMVFCQNDEYIYAGHPSTAWNFIALCFK